MTNAERMIFAAVYAQECSRLFYKEKYPLDMAEELAVLRASESLFRFSKIDGSIKDGSALRTLKEFKK